MITIIKTKKQIYTKLPLLLLSILLLGAAPLLIGLIGAYFSELATGTPCHEGNCFWMVLPWYVFFTFPLSLLALVIIGIISVKDILKLRNQ